MKTALLDSAEHAVRSRGFDGFSYADLANSVGIRKASIHYHFPTKADLALVLIKRYTESFYAALDVIATDRANGGDCLRAYIAIYRAALADGDELCLCVAFCTGRDSLSAPVLAKLNDFHAAVTTWLTGVFALGQSDGSIRSVQNPDQEARACLAQMEGAQLIARAAKNAVIFDQATAVTATRIR